MKLIGGDDAAVRVARELVLEFENADVMLAAGPAAPGQLAHVPERREIAVRPVENIDGIQKFLFHVEERNRHASMVATHRTIVQSFKGQEIHLPLDGMQVAASGIGPMVRCGIGRVMIQHHQLHVPLVRHPPVLDGICHPPELVTIIHPFGMPEQEASGTHSGMAARVVLDDAETAAMIADTRFIERSILSQQLSDVPLAFLYRDPGFLQHVLKLFQSVILVVGIVAMKCPVTGEFEDRKDWQRERECFRLDNLKSYLL